MWVRTGVVLSREQTRALKEHARRLGYISLSRFLRCLLSAELREPRIPSARNYIGRSPRAIALARPKQQASQDTER